MNEHKFTDKLILIVFLALGSSFLSALYISAAQASNIKTNEIKHSGSQAGEADNHQSTINF